MKPLSSAKLVSIFTLLAFFLSPVHASNRYALTVTYNGSGIVFRNPNFQQYPDGAVVGLTARPDPGWLFSHWSGDVEGSSNPTQIQMFGPSHVTANFIETPAYTLTTQVTGQGTIALDPPDGNYASNTVVQFTATASSGWIFSHWTGNATGSANPLSLTMDGDKSVTANFAELVAITNAPENVITNSGSTVTFVVQARGTGPLTYLWKFGNEPIPGADTSSLLLPNVQGSHEGTYTVTILGPHNEASASAELTLTDSACEGTNVVNTPSESALRAAIEKGGYVRLCFNGTITLTNTISITKHVTLDASARNVTISGNEATRIFNVGRNLTLALTNVTLTGGRHRGSDDPTGGKPGFGGAIWNNSGTVILAHCTLTNNVAIGGNGIDSVTTLAPGGSASGGAIFNDRGSVQILVSTISSNSAVAGAGNAVFATRAAGGQAQGGALASIGGTIAIFDSILESNFSQSGLGGFPTSIASGGAIYLENVSALLTKGSVRNNIASGTDAPMSSFGGDSLFPSAALGGGIRTVGGTLQVLDSLFGGNIAEGGNGTSGMLGAGGAIYSEGDVTVRSSTFSSNKATGGSGRNFGGRGIAGAWYNSAMSSASESAFYENLAQGGDNVDGRARPPGAAYGGAFANAHTLFLTNITAALNVARGGVAGSVVFTPYVGRSVGGAIYNETNGSIYSLNATFASNKLDRLAFLYGEGFLGANIATSGQITLRNSIIAYPNDTNSNVHGPITDGGHNICSDGSANFNSGTSFNFTDPRLEPLAANGGPTLTMALRADSPAIDFGDPINAPSMDQRGFARPTGNGVDIGAFEFAPPAHVTPNLGVRLQPNGRVLIWFADSSENTYELQSSSDLLNWQPIETFTGSSEFSREYPPEGSVGFYRAIVK